MHYGFDYEHAPCYQCSQKKLDQSDFSKSEFFLAARPVDLMTTAPCVLNVPGTSRIASIVPVVLTL